MFKRVYLSFAVLKGKFYFIPTVKHSWGDCGCWDVQILLGNLAFGVARICKQSMAFLEAKKQLEDLLK